MEELNLQDYRMIFMSMRGVARPVPVEADAMPQFSHTLNKVLKNAQELEKAARAEQEAAAAAKGNGAAADA